MTVKSCIPVIPSADLEKSLRFWVEGLGLTVDREMRREDKLIGCMVHNDIHVFGLTRGRARPSRQRIMRASGFIGCHRTFMEPGSV